MGIFVSLNRSGKASTSQRQLQQWIKQACPLISVPSLKASFVWWHCTGCPVSNPLCKYLFHLPWWMQQNSDRLTKVLLPTRATADLLCCCPVTNHRTRLATHAFYTSECIALLNGGIAPKLQLKRRPQSHRDSDIQKDGLSLQWDVDVSTQEEFAWCFQAHVDNDRTSHYFWTPLTLRAAVVVTTTAQMQGDAMTNRAKFTYVKDVALEKRLVQRFKQRICGKLGFWFIKHTVSDWGFATIALSKTDGWC